MSLFKKVLASVGIGSARVDTKLENDVLVPGKEVRGTVEIKGGETEQAIDEIYISVNTSYIKERDDNKYTVQVSLGNYPVSGPFTIKAGETREIPFSFELPLDTPVSSGRTKIWLSTGLDIKNAVDPTDKDYIRVLPTPVVSAVLGAAESLGFRLRQSECKEIKRGYGGRLPMVQEFEFVPVSGPYRGRLDELEISFTRVNHDQAEILMQVDRKARGLGGFLSEALEMDETNVRLTIYSSDTQEVKRELENVISRYS